MHVEEDSLYNLAAAQLQGTHLTDAQSRQQRHLSECRECYERFCIYLTVMDLTGGAFWPEEDREENGRELDDKAKSMAGEHKEEKKDEQKTEDSNKESERMKDVLLQIQLAGTFIASVCSVSKDASFWNFMHISGCAAARGAKNEKESDIYVSGRSEYSQIRREGNRIIIQLDEETFPVELLGVRYEENGKSVIRRFSYNEDTECYEAVIDRNGRTDDITVEVVWL